LAVATAWAGGAEGFAGGALVEGGAAQTAPQLMMKPSVKQPAKSVERGP
jgi:hypothetical protein